MTELTVSLELPIPHVLANSFFALRSVGSCLVLAKVEFALRMSVNVVGLARAYPALRPVCFPLGKVVGDWAMMNSLSPSGLLL